MKEGERSEPSFSKVPNLIYLSFGYHVILIKVNTPPWRSHGQAKLVDTNRTVWCLEEKCWVKLWDAYLKWWMYPQLDGFFKRVRLKLYHLCCLVKMWYAFMWSSGLHQNAKGRWMQLHIWPAKPGEPKPHLYHTMHGGGLWEEVVVERIGLLHWRFPRAQAGGWSRRAASGRSEHVVSYFFDP